ncbi:MAG: rRNA pseudouridine synthase [Limnochordales bacterium]|nr:rRNA pseudouridine synthase [Limnochordales bacterium]
MSESERERRSLRVQADAEEAGRVRLHKLLALRGVCSRRHGEELIRSGKVRVNGEVVREVGIKVDPERDRVEVNGKPLPPPPKLVYFILNKPRNVLTTLRDDRGRPTIKDLLPHGLPRLFPVGRLDWDSEGLLLLTNDGELAYRLTHPRYQIQKTYRVTVERPIEDGELEMLRRGVMLDDGPTGPAEVRRLGEREFLIGIGEGRNRQVRRMCAAVGHRVVRLVRIAEGPVRLGGLASGALRPLSAREVAALRRAVGLEPIR